MKDLIAASRYAKSLLELAIEQDNLGQIHRDVVLVSDTLKGSPDLVLLLKSPIVHPDKKMTIITKIFKGNLDEMLLKYFELIIKKRRENFLPSILNSFIEQYKEYKGIETVDVISVQPLSNKNKELLIKQIQKIIGGEIKESKIDVNEIIDESIIGGIIIRNKGNQIDQSIKRQLKDIEKQLILN